MGARVPVTIRVNGLPVGSDTRYCSPAPFVVVLTTGIASGRATLLVTSTYTGHPSTATHASHLIVRPRVEPHIATETHPVGLLALEGSARRACLYDHLQQVLAVLRTTSRQASVHVFEHGAEVLDT